MDMVTDNIDIWTSAIKTRSSAGRGSSKKLDLYGIKKLRELILELAVRGKLVPQDPNDEPASVLLERIAAEKTQLVKEKKIKKPKKIEEILESEKLFELPTKWEWARLDQLSPMSLFDGDWIESKDQDPSGEIRLIQLGDVGVNEFKDVSTKYINVEAFARLNCTQLMQGDILIARLPSPIGRACIFPSLSKMAITAVDVAILRHLNLLDEQYLVHSINSITFRNQVEEYGKGATRFRISTGNLKTILVPVPPLAEQHRIVAKVDELMALCDQLEQQTEASIDAHATLVETLLTTLTNSADAAELEQNWTRLADHFDTLFTTEQSIDQLKQTVLQLAVMGKLVPQDPNDEPAAVLLEKIAAEKTQLIKEKKIKKQKPLPSITEDEKPFALPEGWEWVNLQKLITVMDAGWSPACPPEPSPNDQTWGVLKTTAVQTLEYREIENKVLAAGKEPRQQYEVQAGDILVTRAGPKNRVGISCLVISTRPKLMISDKIIRFHLVELGLSERFISLCLNAGATADYLDAAKSGMAESQMNISQDKLKAAPIPLCPISEQKRMVNKVDQLMALCDELKTRLQHAQQTQLHLADALVEQAVG